MKNKQEIEEMAKIIGKIYLPVMRGVITVGEKRLSENDSTRIARALYNAGYRDEKETAREILQEVKQRLYDREIEAERILRCIKFDELAEKHGVEVE